MNKNVKLNALLEVRHEITRLNRAAGHVVFNPAATKLVDRMIEELAAHAAEWRQTRMMRAAGD